MATLKSNYFTVQSSFTPSSVLYNSAIPAWIHNNVIEQNLTKIFEENNFEFVEIKKLSKTGVVFINK
jgi:hypothetical protein